MAFASRQERIDYNRRWHKEVAERRTELLAQFSCVCCGDPDDTVIQWHHVEPEDKSFGIWERASEDAWWNEVLKCIPVCANCHIKIHKNKLCLINPIGYKHLSDTESICAPESTCPQSPQS